ncbi:MAG: ATP-binding protein [Candidatus Omnitrophota bacterium]
MAAIVSIAFLAKFGMDNLSALRAYVGGNTLWASAQKDASYNISQYIFTRDEKNYQEFRRLLNIPLGDKKVRLELDKPKPNLDIVAQGSLEGLNSPKDIKRAADFFRRFRKTYYMDRVVKIWVEGDSLIAELEKAGSELHLLYPSPGASSEKSYLESVERIRNRIEIINEKLHIVENNFSYTLGEASRWATNVFARIMFLGVLIIILFGLLGVYFIVRDIVRRLEALVLVSKKVGAGDFSVRANTSVGDEIGSLADSFNHMTDSLDKSNKEVLKKTEDLEGERQNLEQRVKERTAELTKSQTAMLYMVEDLNNQAKELKDAQDRIIRSEKMAVVGQLASSVAHELRNPLGVMKNAVYYLNMLGLGKDNSDIKENLEIISKEIDNSDKVISDLLEFSRIKQPALRSEDINLIIKEALNRVKASAGIEVVTELSKDLPQVRVDALQMQQVFYNLAQNAIQAMEKGGGLTVSSCVTHDKNIAIVFKDTGCGIPKENLRKIFEPLFSTKIKGTGLGLSVVASLVEGHGGKLEVESEIGKGSLFTVKLPVKME